VKNSASGVWRVLDKGEKDRGNAFKEGKEDFRNVPASSGIQGKKVGERLEKKPRSFSRTGGKTCPSGCKKKKPQNIAEKKLKGKGFGGKVWYFQSRGRRVTKRVVGRRGARRELTGKKDCRKGVLSGEILGRMAHSITEGT